MKPPVGFAWKEVKESTLVEINYFDLLAVLRFHEDGLTTEELIAACLSEQEPPETEKQTILRAAVELAQKGYLRLYHDVSGERQLNVSLTEQGVQYVDTVSDIVSEGIIVNWQRQSLPGGGNTEEQYA